MRWHPDGRFGLTRSEKIDLPGAISGAVPDALIGLRSHRHWALDPPFVFLPPTFFRPDSLLTILSTLDADALDLRRRKRALVDEMIERDAEQRRRERERAADERRILLGHDPTVEQQEAVIRGRLADLGIGDVDDLDGEAADFAAAARAIWQRQQQRSAANFRRLSDWLVGKYRPARSACLAPRPRVSARSRGAGRPRGGRSRARSGSSGSGSDGPSSDAGDEPAEPFVDHPRFGKINAALARFLRRLGGDA